MTGDDLIRAKAAVTRADDGEAERALALVRLDRGLTCKPIGALSGGQFQRLLVAAALVGRPNVLLLDEPTSGVDEPGQERLNATIDRLRRDLGLTVLLISHDLSVVSRFATRVLCLGRGLAWLGPPAAALAPARLEELYGEPIGYHSHDHD